jgi:hypothetical protein
MRRDWCQIPGRSGPESPKSVAALADFPVGGFSARFGYRGAGALRKPRLSFGAARFAFYFFGSFPGRNFTSLSRFLSPGFSSYETASVDMRMMVDGPAGRVS